MEPTSVKPASSSTSTAFTSHAPNVGEKRITGVVQQRITRSDSCCGLKTLANRTCLWLSSCRLVRCIMLIVNRIFFKSLKNPTSITLPPPALPRHLQRAHSEASAHPTVTSPSANPSVAPLERPPTSPLSPSLSSTAEPATTSATSTQSTSSVPATPVLSVTQLSTAQHSLASEFEDFKKNIQEALDRMTASTERFTKADSQSLFVNATAVDQLCELVADLNFTIALSMNGQWRFKDQLAKDASFSLEAITKNLEQFKEQLKKGVSETGIRVKITAHLKNKFESLEKQLREQKKAPKAPAAPRLEVETKEKRESEGKREAEKKPPVNFMQIQQCQNLKYQFCLLRDNLQVDVRDNVTKLNRIETEFGLVSHHSDPTSLFGIAGTLQRDQGGLFNITNSCYINSTIAYMRPFLMQLIRPKLTPKRETDKQYQSRLYIKWLFTEILQLSMVPLTGDKEQAKQVNTALLAALYDLRFRLFESGLNPDLTVDAREGYAKQQDGTGLGNTLLEIFGWELTQLTTRFHVGEFDGIPITDYPSSQPARFISMDLPSAEVQCMQKLVDSYFGRNAGTEEYNKIKNYTSQLSFEGPPAAFLPIQIKRVARVKEEDKKELHIKKEQIRKEKSDEILEQLAIERTPPEMIHLAMENAVHKLACDALGIDETLTDRKISTPLVFPAGYILDFSLAYGRAVGSVRYRVCGVQQHHGETGLGGHLTAVAFDPDRAHLRHYDDNRVRVIPPTDHAKELSSACNLLLELMPS